MLARPTCFRNLHQCLKTSKDGVKLLAPPSPPIKNSTGELLKFHAVTNVLRQFFIKKRFVEVNPQSRISILAACEDPWTIGKFKREGEWWPLPQTGQMWLEHDLLKNPRLNGVFCVTTSYRWEKNLVEGRHEPTGVFPMFEVESKGNMRDMIELQKEMLEALGFSRTLFNELDYSTACNRYNSKEIEHEEEKKMYNDYGPTTFLKHFPLETHPFWNMKLVNVEGVTKAAKVDVIIGGQETIGSAERSCDKDEMRERFFGVEDGRYANKLFELFGEERVIHELDEFLNLDFFPRFGWGKGIKRLIAGMEKEGIFPEGDE